MNLDHIFQYHAPKPGQPEKYERLRAAAKKYAEALISQRVLDEDDNLVIELSYEDYVRVLNELVPTDSVEYGQAMKFIDQAYDIAVDPDRAIVLLVQGASMFANAAVALENHG